MHETEAVTRHSIHRFTLPSYYNRMNEKYLKIPRSGGNVKRNLLQRKCLNFSVSGLTFCCDCWLQTADCWTCVLGLMKGLEILNVILIDWFRINSTSTKPELSSPTRPNHPVERSSFCIWSVLKSSSLHWKTDNMF